MVRPVQRHQYLQRLRSVLGRSLQVLLPRLQWKEALVKTKGLRPARRDQQEHLLLRLQWKEIHSLDKTKCRVVYNVFVQFWDGVFSIFFCAYSGRRFTALSQLSVSSSPSLLSGGGGGKALVKIQQRRLCSVLGQSLQHLLLRLQWEERDQQPRPVLGRSLQLRGDQVH